VAELYAGAAYNNEISNNVKISKAEIENMRKKEKWRRLHVWRISMWLWQ